MDTHCVLPEHASPESWARRQGEFPGCLSHREAAEGRARRRHGRDCAEGTAVRASRVRRRRDGVRAALASLLPVPVGAQIANVRGDMNSIDGWLRDLPSSLCCCPSSWAAPAAAAHRRPRGRSVSRDYGQVLQGLNRRRDDCRRSVTSSISGDTGCTAPARPFSGLSVGSKSSCTTS